MDFEQGRLVSLHGFAQIVQCRFTTVGASHTESPLAYLSQASHYFFIVGNFTSSSLIMVKVNLVDTRIYVGLV